jgi:hypothetical protein
MPTSKAHLVEMMTLFPQRCIVTGYPNQKGQDPALDLGFDIDQYGHAYVSALGMEWLARQFGFVSNTEAETDVTKLREELASAKTRISELEQSVARIPESVEGILDGLKQLSLNAVNDLLGIAGINVDGNDSVPPFEGDAQNEDAHRPIVKTTGRNNKASS